MSMLMLTGTMPTTTVRMRMEEPATLRPLMTVQTTRRDTATTGRRRTNTPTPKPTRAARLKPATTRKEHDTTLATPNNVPTIITITGMVAMTGGMATENPNQNFWFQIQPSDLPQ